MSVYAESQGAVEALQQIQQLMLEQGDSSLEDDLANLICSLDNPILTQLLKIQDSIDELNRTQQITPLKLDDFDINNSGELVLNEDIKERLAQNVTTVEVQQDAQTTPHYDKDFMANIEAAAQERPTHIIQLYKSEAQSLGFSVVGLKSENRGELGIFVQEIQPGGVAARDGRLEESDQILAIDGQVLDSNISHQQAIRILQAAAGIVTLVVARGTIPSTDSVVAPESALEHAPSLPSETGSSDMSESSDHVPVDISQPKKRQRKVPPKQVRGRGRGRGGSRGGETRSRGNGQQRRGRRGGHGGRGRGGMDMTPESVNTWAQMREKRSERVQEAIDKLPEAEVRGLLKQVALQHPGVFHSVVSAASGSNDPQPPKPGPEDPDIPFWCICTRCRWMTPPPHPTKGEDLDPNDECCHMTPQDCLSIMPEFEAFCLDDMSVHMNMWYRGDAFGLRATTEADIKKSKRHAAYRLFILWRHGMLTQGDRRVVPSCCTLAIRNKYPDAGGHTLDLKQGPCFEFTQT